jgi:hypothetical protein
METSSPAPNQKKGIGTLGWLGIGCGGLVVLAIIGTIVAVFFVGAKLKDVTKEAQQNPTRAAASIVVKMGVGEMIAEDDVNKRYTVREKRTGTLTTFYWDAKRKEPASVNGDFSAIPADASAPDVPPPANEPATSAPDQKK